MQSLQVPEEVVAFSAGGDGGRKSPDLYAPLIDVICFCSEAIGSTYPSATWGLAGEPRMDKLLFWLGIGAAQKGAGSKPIERRHWVASLVVGILVALLIAVGMFFLLVSQQ
jgi:hypothetical protein